MESLPTDRSQRDERPLLAYSSSTSHLYSRSAAPPRRDETRPSEPSVRGGTRPGLQRQAVNGLSWCGDTLKERSVSDHCRSLRTIARLLLPQISSPGVRLHAVPDVFNLRRP
ncbi:unnamed protein product [Gadus morhua 'NCC']